MIFKTWKKLDCKIEIAIFLAGQAPGHRAVNEWQAGPRTYTNTFIVGILSKAQIKMQDRISLSLGQTMGVGILDIDKQSYVSLIDILIAALGNVHNKF